MGGLAILTLATVVDTVASAGPTPPATGEFVPLPATGLVDTASDPGGSGPLQPDETRSVTATGVGEVPTTGVLAVMVHLTTSNSASTAVNANGNVWAWAAGTTRPKYALVANAPLGSVADNTAIVRVGTAGAISFYNGSNGTAVDIKADIEGYVTSGTAQPAGATFAPLTPQRVIDTSDGTGGRSTPLTSSDVWSFDALGAGGIPTSGVAAIALNVGAGATSSDCWVQVQPGGTDPSNANYPRVDTYAGYTAQEFAVVAPDASGNVTFSTSCASTDIFADVEGYYLTAADGSSGDIYVPLANPKRVIDTRRNVGINGKMTAGRMISGALAVPVAGFPGVPSAADAVLLNVGATNATGHGSNTIWTDGTARPATTSTVEIDPNVAESNLAIVGTGARGKIDVAAASADPTASNDLYVDVEGYFSHPTSKYAFGAPHYFPDVTDDTFYNTVSTGGDIIATANDSTGVNNSCTTRGSDIAILKMRGPDPAHLSVTTVNCMTSYGPRAGGANPGPDGCSWKSGGITRVGRTIYMAVARQLKKCSYGLETNGLQPSFNASIIKSVDGGKTWTNPWGTTNGTGAAPPYSSQLKRYRAMFPGRNFSAPFFVQYGPGNTQTADGGAKYLYSVSTDGYTYNGNYLHLARVPLNKIQDRTAWQFYHGSVGGAGLSWTRSLEGATRVLQAKRGVSQPAIQYVPSLKQYVLVTSVFSQGGADFPTSAETPYTQLRIYTAPKPWGPWTKNFDHTGQRSLWCVSSPCQMTQQPGSTAMNIGAPGDWLGLYDLALVQKFVFTRPLADQALLTCGDWKNATRYPGERLNRLHVLPLNLTSVLGS